jgi:hypothetical protein
MSPRVVEAVGEASMLDETVFRVTNFRYHANPSSDRVFSAVDATIQHFNESRQRMLNALLANGADGSRVT